MSFKKLLIVPVIGVLGVLSIASAAALGVDSGANQAGSDLVLICDDSGVQVFHQNNFSGGEYRTQGVTVAGIDSDCDGMTMKVTLTDINGNYLAEDANSGITSGDNEHFDFTAANIPASSVYGVHVAIQ